MKTFPAASGDHIYIPNIFLPIAFNGVGTGRSTSEQKKRF